MEAATAQYEAEQAAAQQEAAQANADVATKALAEADEEAEA
ncbi:hypothetical protein [Novosphingobium sp. SG720]|nr:hypothetical protein [Novosphingobium sp. SG720]NKJ43694.1 hypothetical protein [Novosphingobium sp. SG720]